MFFSFCFFFFIVAVIFLSTLGNYCLSWFGIVFVNVSLDLCRCILLNLFSYLMVGHKVMKYVSVWRELQMLKNWKMLAICCFTNIAVGKFYTMLLSLYLFANSLFVCVCVSLNRKPFEPNVLTWPLYEMQMDRNCNDPFGSWPFCSYLLSLTIQVHCNTENIHEKEKLPST